MRSIHPARGPTRWRVGAREHRHQQRPDPSIPAARPLQVPGHAPQQAGPRPEGVRQEAEEQAGSVLQGAEYIPRLLQTPHQAQARQDGKTAQVSEAEVERGEVGEHGGEGGAGAAQY